MKERLQKVLARAGIGSRRKAEELIKQGRVTIDGKIVNAMGVKVDPQHHRITVDGKPITFWTKNIYLLLNKPKGYVTTLHDPQGRPIVTSLLHGVKMRVFPVGRLDLDTEGALLLTNDGEFAHCILHPRFEIKKTYIARVAGKPSPKKLSMLEQGIELEGRKTWPAKLTVVAAGRSDTTVEIIIHEGRKRQVRKMFDAIGHRVLDLKRIAYGGLKLGKLPSGKFRFLTQKDLAKVFPGKNPLYNKRGTSI